MAVAKAAEMAAAYKKLEAMTQKEYVERVHTALERKGTEWKLLAKWFESPEMVRGINTDASPADKTQLDHMWRRYDEGLSHIGGFHYNPHRAYFDRDSYGTGVLRFEEGVSLIGSQANQNRWTFPRPIVGFEHVTRSARLDAFLAMLEQRQAMAQWSGLAPICIFIGSKLPLTDLQDPNRRLPPRPVDRQIPAGRYVRFCMVTQVLPEINTTNPPVWCVSLIERHFLFADEVITDPETEDTSLKPTLLPPTIQMYSLCPDNRVSQDLVKKAVWARWHELTTANSSAAAVAGYDVFNATGIASFRGQKNTYHDFIPCPAGDSQMIHRLGLLLESPFLGGYRPWNVVPQPPAFADLDTLLAIGPGLTPKEWMNYSLMGRVYPYALLGKEYMINTIRMTAYDNEVTLTKKEADTFRESIVPVPKTKWIKPKTKKKKKEKKTKKKLTPQPRPISQNALLAFVEELHGYKPGDLQRLFGKAAMAWKYKKGPSATHLLNKGNLRAARVRAVPTKRRHRPPSHHNTPLRIASRYQKHSEDLLSPCLQRSLEHPGVALHLDRLRLYHE